MTKVLPSFYAYPSQPAIVGETIEQAIGNLREKSGITTVQSWRENDIAGRFIADQILEKISDRAALIADVTQLNFNVAYEIGFALAKEKRVVLTRHKGVTPYRPLVADVDYLTHLGTSNMRMRMNWKLIFAELPIPRLQPETYTQ